MKTTIVTTTINVPRFLTAYSDDAIRYGREVDFIVIGDQKTPSEAKEFCLTIPNCNYMDIQAQQEYMHRFPELWEHIPFNSFERRDIGILKAYENGADTVITIDDDNLLACDDMLFWHDMVGHYAELPVYKSTSGWFNVCSILKEENGIKFYHRGYSPRHKWERNAYTSAQVRYAKVVVNAGLWFNNPDTDAITRLERKLNVIDFDNQDDTGNIALAPGTWSPFNCQNTAIARDLIPAYFMSPHIGRHSDIFASYVIARLAEHFGDVIAFGMPFSNHDRSEHNLWHDLEIEKWGMQHTDEFCDVLRSARLTATTYHEGFGQLIEHLKWAASFQKVVEGMQIWYNVFKRII